MDLTLVELIVLVVAVAGSATMTGAAVWFWTRVKRLEEGRGAGLPTGPELRLQVEALRDDLEASRERTRSLTERVDFLERLLEGREPGEAGEEALPAGRREGRGS